MMTKHLVIAGRDDDADGGALAQDHPLIDDSGEMMTFNKGDNQKKEMM